MADVPGSSAPQAAPVAAPATTPQAPSLNTSAQAQNQAQQAGQPKAAVVADLKEQAQTGTPKEQAQAKKMLKSLKIKFNGQEYNEVLPFEIPDDQASRDYMSKQLQMSRLAQSKSQEYSTLEKEVQSFVEELRKNPRKALSDPAFGIDVKKLAAEIIEEEIANSEKSPEQLKTEKLEAELKAMKEAQEQDKEERKAREFERLQEQEFTRYEDLMVKALDGSKLPKSPYVVKKIADYMLLGLQAGHDVTPQDVLPLVEQEMHSDLKEMFAAMPEDVIEALVGKDVITRIRKKNIAKAKGANTPPVPVNSAIKDVGKKAEPKTAEKKQTFKNFFGT